MEKLLLIFLILFTYSYSQENRIVRQQELTDSLDAVRTLIGTGGVPLPATVVHTNTTQTITGQKNFSTIKVGTDTVDVGKRISGMVNVKEFGAACDGVTNDSAAFVDAINSLTNGGTLVISGVLGLGSSGWTGIRISNKSNITIRGADVYSGIKPLAIPSQNFTSVPAIIYIENCDNITFSNMRIYGNNIASAFLILDSVQYSDFSYLTIDSMGGTGIFSVGGSNNKYTNNTIINNVGLGLLIGNTNVGYIEDRALISGNYVSNNLASGINGTYKNSIVTDNNCTDNVGGGIAISAYNTEIGMNSVISNNYCARNGFHGIQTDAYGGVYNSGVTISNNVLVDNVGSGVYLANGSDCTISNNIMINNNRSGVLLYNAHNINVLGNRTYGLDTLATAGVFLEVNDKDIYNVIISNNIISRFNTGIALSSGTGNISNVTINANQIDSCSVYGIQINSGDTITLYNNHSLNNPTDIRVDVYATGSGNIYNTISGTITTPTAPDGVIELLNQDFVNNDYFGGLSFYNPTLHNILFSATSRFTVADTGFSSITEQFLFNGLYDGAALVDSADTAKLYIDFMDKGEYSTSGVVYADGYILIHFYNGAPDSLSCDYLLKDSTNWHSITTIEDISIDTTISLYKITIPYIRYLTDIRFYIVGGSATLLSEIEYYPLRYESQLITPVVAKNIPNVLYDKLSWKNFNNTEVAYIDSNGNADFKTLSINGILQTGSGAIGNADSLGAIPASGYLLKSDSTIYLTPSDANSAYATKSHTHTEFFDTLSISFGVMDTVTAGDYVGRKIENNITITEIAAYTNTGTVTFNIEERGETTPNTAGTDVMTSDLVADDNQQETTTFSNSGIARDSWLVLNVTSKTGDPTIFGVTIRYVKTN